MVICRRTNSLSATSRSEGVSQQSSAEVEGYGTKVQDYQIVDPIEHMFLIKKMLRRRSLVVGIVVISVPGHWWALVGPPSLKGWPSSRWPHSRIARTI
jgi:hypothetical protein